MILDTICSDKREEVALRKVAVPESDLREKIASMETARDFRSALRGPRISLIAEIKKASPSKGPIAPNLVPADLATAYQAAGANALSILTDRKYFGGTLEDLQAARRKVSLPCLRKDFVVDEYQLYEAREAGADAALLIVRVLSKNQLSDYLALTKEIGLAALVETHSAQEIEQAIDAGAHIIGINNRDLSTFTVRLDMTLELRKYVPGGHVLVSESGIFTREDVRRLEEGGVDAILVGEALVTSPNVRAKVRELLGEDEHTD